MPELAVAKSQPLPRAVLRHLIARQALPLLLIALVIWLLRDRAAGLDIGGILGAARSIPAAAWAVAAIATLVSFWAVGRYDALVHRFLGTGVCGSAARWSGIAAIATAQTAGFGLLTGTLARWRMLPSLSLWQSARVTMAVTASFMAGLVIVGAGVAMIAGVDGPVPRGPAMLVLAGAVAFAAVSLWRPRRWRSLALPPLRTQGAVVGLVALDTLGAALALYVLLPTGEMPPVALYYSVFVLALGAGLIGATPGGIGPFEVVCLACLPSVPEASLLAAIAGYRVIYFGIPGALALCALIVGARQAGGTAEATGPLLVAPGRISDRVRDLDAILHRAPRAEAQLLHQGELGLLFGTDGTAVPAAACGQSLIFVGDPLSRTPPPDRVITQASKAGEARGLVPVFYKCSARLAVAARRAGWRIVQVSHEAWIVPQTHDPARRACRQLRRSLRKAETGGLRVAEAGAFLPVEDMTQIANKWARQRPGAARGFSLGRFSPALLHKQRVFLCYDSQRRLVAFATFHVARAEWTLDQMCQTAQTPSGAMHLLVDTAIAAAARQHCPRLSLAAVPCPPSAWLPRRLADRLEARSGAPGLRRFKSSFDPNWEPLYLAASSMFGLTLGSIDLIDRITRPGPRPAAPRLD